MLRPLALAAALLPAGSAHAQFSAVPTPDLPAVPRGGANLVVDDGTAEAAIGLNNGGQFLWFNRFSPPEADFPMAIVEVQVYFARGGNVQKGDTLDIHVYTDDDQNPYNGTIYVGGLRNVTIEELDAFSTYLVPVPFAVTDPGDVMIGVVNRGMDAPDQDPATVDLTTWEGRSWVALWTETPPPDPPLLPAPLMAPAEDAGIFGNWMIRGTYVTVPVAGEEGPARRVRLDPAAPNPVFGQAEVAYELAETGPVHLALYDVTGREVAVLDVGVRPAGRHTAVLDAAGLAPGVYVARLRTEGRVLVQRVSVNR